MKETSNLNYEPMNCWFSYYPEKENRFVISINGTNYTLVPAELQNILSSMNQLFNIITIQKGAEGIRNFLNPVNSEELNATDAIKEVEELLKEKDNDNNKAS